MTYVCTYLFIATSCISLTRNLGQKKTQFRNLMPDWRLCMYHEN